MYKHIIHALAYICIGYHKYRAVASLLDIVGSRNLAQGIACTFFYSMYPRADNITWACTRRNLITPWPIANVSALFTSTLYAPLDLSNLRVFGHSVCSEGNYLYLRIVDPNSYSWL